MSESNKSAIRKLWRNEPHDDEQDRLYLNAFTSVSAQDFADALLQNTTCKRLNLLDASRQPPSMEEADWVPFWNAISSSLVLEQVTIYDPNRGTLHSDRLLVAVARSSSIKQI